MCLVKERPDDWEDADKKVIGVKLFSGTKQRMARLHHRQVSTNAKNS